jgi:transposase
MRLKELSVELRDRIVMRYRSGEGSQNISAALKVSKNTVASIILKWKKFGTTRGEIRGERRWSGRLPRTQWSLTELQSSPVDIGEPSRRTTISAALHQSGLYGSVQTEATPQ